MNRDPRIALSQELEAKQMLLDQLRAPAADGPDCFTELLEGETNVLELIAALDASIVKPSSAGRAQSARAAGILGARSRRRARRQAGARKALAQDRKPSK